jgi:hypothetical protein
MGNRPVELEASHADAVSQSLQLLIGAVGTLRSYPPNNDIGKPAISRLPAKREQVVPFGIELSREGVRGSGCGAEELTCDHSTVMGALFRDGLRRISLQHDADLRHMPKVRLILDADGSPAADLAVDLASTAKESEPLQIAGVLDPADYGIEPMDYIL